jgi:hypothetical protein
MKKLDDETRKKRETLVAGQYGGIFPPYEAFYIHSVLYIAGRAIDAFSRFDAAAVQNDDPARTMATIQEALTHAAGLSRFFWPMKGSQLSASRGKRLRTAFALDDSSPLKSRRLRNSFEHFDEDLDRFLLNDPTGCFFPGPIVGDHVLADDAIGNVFRLVDVKTGTCVLLGQKFEFRPIRAEVLRVDARAVELDRLGARLR